jgi:hypothetical protein
MSREDNIYYARLAEQGERYEDMIRYMKQVSHVNTQVFIYKPSNYHYVDFTSSRELFIYFYLTFTNEYIFRVGKSSQMKKETFSVLPIRTL